MRSMRRFWPSRRWRRWICRGARRDITHLIVASCTGFVAPGLDQLLARRLGLRADLQRSVIGFMGCSAAVPALRIAQAAVLADPTARVLVVNLELCTLHMQETDNVEIALSFLLFGDGCTASLVTAEEHGIALGDFRTALDPRYRGAYHLAYRRPGFRHASLRPGSGENHRGPARES